FAWQLGKGWLERRAQLTHSPSSRGERIRGATLLPQRDPVPGTTTPRVVVPTQGPESPQPISFARLADLESLGERRRRAPRSQGSLGRSRFFAKPIWPFAFQCAALIITMRVSHLLNTRG